MGGNVEKGAGRIQRSKAGWRERCLGQHECPPVYKQPARPPPSFPSFSIRLNSCEKDNVEKHLFIIAIFILRARMSWRSGGEARN